MGYDIHITRRKLWFDKGDDIARDEFARHVRSDLEFRYPGENGDDYADWRSPKTGYESWLCWSDGQIDTKNPEPEFIDKMVAVAANFSQKFRATTEKFTCPRRRFRRRRLSQLHPCDVLQHLLQQFFSGRFGSSWLPLSCWAVSCWP